LCGGNPPKGAGRKDWAIIMGFPILWLAAPSKPVF
jgi:hypothetical protein